MKILIVGSGGREHAIAASVAKSPKAEKIYCAPGNAGIAQLAECVPIGAMEFDRLTEFAKEKEIDLVIVGMDDPLVGGSGRRSWRQPGSVHSVLAKMRRFWKVQQGIFQGTDEKIQYSDG